MRIKLIDKKNYLKIWFTVIFLFYFFVSYPITYFLVETPYLNCSKFFELYNKFIQFDSQNPNCILVTENDIKDVFHIFFLWFIFFIIFFFIINELIKEKFLLNNKFINVLCKFNYDSEIVYKLIIITSPILYIFDFFYDVVSFNKIFLLNKYVLLFLVFWFFYKSTFKFVLYILVFSIPILIGDIADSIYLLSILFLMSFYKNIKFKKIFLNSIIFLNIIIFLLFSQDYLRDNYNQINHNNNQINNYNYRIDVSPVKERFKFVNYIKNDKIFKIVDQILSRLSEINHTVIVKKLLDDNYIQYLEGETYKRLPLILIPRLIYPNKPKEIFGNVLICKFGIGNNYDNEKDCYNNVVTSINLNVILEGYINYKIPGLLFSAFCLSLLACLSFKLISHNKYYINVFGFVVMYQSILYGSNLSGVIGGIIFAIVAIVPIITIKQFNKISKLDK